MLSAVKEISANTLKLFTIATSLMLVACGGSSDSASPASLPPNVSAALAQSGVDLAAPSASDSQEASVLHAIFPASGELDLQGKITLVFLHPVDSESTTPEMIQLYNETQGYFVDLEFQFNGHEVSVIPTTSPTRPDQYILLVHQGIPLTNGSQLQESFWLDFALPPLSPLTLEISADSAIIERPRSDLQMIFKSQMDPESLTENVTLFDITTNEPEDIEIRHDPGQHGFFVNPVFSLNADHTYELTIKPGVQDIYGRTLEHDFVKRYTVTSGPFHPTIDISSPADGQEDFDPANEIVIQFSELMDPTSVSSDHNYIRAFYGTETFVPSTAYIEADKLIIVPDTPLEYGRSYEIELPYLHPDWLVATNGYQLHGFHTIHFRTIENPN